MMTWLQTLHAPFIETLMKIFRMLGKYFLAIAWANG